MLNSIKILAVSPYEGLGEFFASCAKTFPGLTVSLLTANLQEAVQNLPGYRDYDIVISRGGTAQVLRECLTIPVIEVDVSVYDMLRVIKMAQQTGKRFAVMGFANMIKTSDIICEILQYDISTFTIDSEDAAREVMDRLVREGVELVVGDVVTTNLASQAGLRTLLITSGFESVEKSLIEAVSLFQNMEKLKRAAPYEALLDASPYKIALFDNQCHLVYTNPAFAEAGAEDLSALLQEYIPRLYAQGTLCLRKRHGNMSHDITGVRLGGAGAHLYAFYCTSAARSVEHDLCIRVESPDYSQQSPADLVFLDADRARAAVEKMAQSDKWPPLVFITGEAGTGVEAFARYTHAAGPFKNSLFITIDCALLTEKIWENMVRRTESPINGLKHTVFLQGVHLLSYGAQLMLYRYMEDTLLIKRHHVISSSAPDLPSLIAGGKFRPQLYQMLKGLSVRLPPLREYPEEIPALVSLFISRYNMEFTKQIIGFEKDALEYLKTYPWEFNLDQLQDIIRQLIAKTDKSYICLADVHAAMPQCRPGGAGSQWISLSGTFAEIEREIIGRVLTEEGMNHSRAAKRLGLGRSTIWRKMTGDV